MLPLILKLIGFLIISSNKLNAILVTQESGLYKKLLSNYYPYSRPISDPNMTLTIYFKLKLTQLVDLSAKENILTTSMWIEQVCKQQAIFLIY